MGSIGDVFYGAGYLNRGSMFFDVKRHLESRGCCYTLIHVSVFVALFGFSVRRGCTHRKYGEEYRTQPLSFHTRALLWVSTAVIVIVVCFSPAPSTWRWSLVGIHTIRVLNVSASLLGQVGVLNLDGITERAGDNTYRS